MDIRRCPETSKDAQGLNRQVRIKDLHNAALVTPCSAEALTRKAAARLVDIARPFSVSSGKGQFFIPALPDAAYCCLNKEEAWTANLDRNVFHN